MWEWMGCAEGKSGYVNWYNGIKKRDENTNVKLYTSALKK